ncbi:MAG TPA: histidine kinase dimerization/phospho-acceptor domain-containing protein [Bdellovibrionales bacterium]|nr:histidine kinase dimerization/phospho-acceptor domain-containing protein [Bdellovibrionales bacterium]
MSAVVERELVTFKSSVLLIGHPNPEKVAFGADFAPTVSEAAEKLRQTRYPVIVSALDTIPTRARSEFFAIMSKLDPDAQHVIVSASQDPRAIQELFGKIRIARLIADFDDPRFDESVQKALEDYMAIKQNQILLQLIREQNQQLTALSGQLEERVEKRQKNLVRAHRRLEMATRKFEALQRALVAVHRSTTVAEMERLVNDALLLALKLSWTRIIFAAQSQLEMLIEKERNNFTILGIPMLREAQKIGHIYFARKASKPFDKDETDFLLQISEAISLAVGRLTALQLSEEIKKQWEATFNAVTAPVSLMTSEYEIIRVNTSYAEKTGRKAASLVGKKCYEALFGRAQPCEGCKLGFKFRIHQKGQAQNNLTIFDVSSQQISFEKDFFTYVNIYRDVSEQLKLERQIVESAKMAELGTIGSSIAHELNNPIGGIITFLQLMKMDMKGDEAYAQDISEMEAAAQRCREIIHNLLSFTRKSETEANEQVDLRDVVRKAVQILELQSRSMGVKLELGLPDTPAIVRGNINLLSHALMNLLQTSIDGVLKIMREDVSYSGVIKVRLSSGEKNFVIEISDNRPETRLDQTALPSVLGLRQTVAAQIISEAGGQLEISSEARASGSAKISLPRPVF